MDLIGLYIKSIRQQHPVGPIIMNNVSLTFMAIVDSTTGWFENLKAPTCNLDEVTGGNDK